MTLRRISLWLISSLLVLTIPVRTSAQTETLVIGGKGTPWGQVVEEWVALDDTTAPGTIQTRELKPWENIVGKNKINIFGFKWHIGKGEPGVYVLRPLEAKLGLNPRFWKREGILADPRLIDGDESTYMAAIHAVPREEYNALATATYSGYEMGYTVLDWEVFTMDLGIVVPVNRIRFFPPQQGRDRWGGLYKNDAPQAYEVSVALHPQDYLLLKREETYVAPDWILHSLDKVLERTFSNSKSIVEITFPPEPLRFIRIKLNLMPQTYALAEIEVYGEGFPPVSRYTSKVIDFEKPVNFGRIFYKFIKFRKTPDGELIEDADAPVRLILETKSGLDDSPWAYHLIGELGEEKEVTRKEYRLALPPKEGYSGSAGSKVPRFGTQASITEDRENWDARSSPYAQSGDEIQSSDGRQYLQFMFSIESDDIFATGRLDSVAFEYSPLLVKRVWGEVSLLDEPNPSGGVVEIPAGVDTTFSYDIKAKFDTLGQSGFDGINIDVPPETKFLRLEMG
ncbi:MAG: hypothetical protein KAT86_07045, partial [Candidatus Latescibacteria bacterium]|nr:hypothetical protein [Candidatus Latescibacterota bacterium]